jgi:hypothetical protein
MADQLSKAAGKPIKYVDVTPDATWQANGLVEGVITQTVRDVTGSDATSFTKFARDYVGRLLGKAAGAS